VDQGRPVVRRAVVDDPEHPPGRGIGFGGHDFGDQVGRTQANWRACASRTSVASPVPTSCSSANWWMVSTIEYRVRPADRRAISIDLRAVGQAVCMRSIERAPAHRADRGRCTHPNHRIRLPRKSFGGRIHRRTPNTAAAAPFRRRRGGRKTTRPRGAAFGGVPARAATRPAAGIGDLDDLVPRWRSSTPSTRRPVRWPRESRRGADKSQ
jgi:hypothetical protein